jgi:hypothetical protein
MKVKIFREGIVMAEKTVAKTGKKGDAQEKMSPGDAYLCEVCGLQVNVDICGDFLASGKSLSCCGKKMAAKGKTAKK